MIRDKWHGAILQALLEQRPIQVYDEDPDGTRTLNATETEAAREKATALQERFAEWVWEDPRVPAKSGLDFLTCGDAARHAGDGRLLGGHGPGDDHEGS